MKYKTNITCRHLHNDARPPKDPNMILQFYQDPIYFVQLVLADNLTLHCIDGGRSVRLEASLDHE